MNYINNKVSNRYRSELGNFIGNYKKWNYTKFDDKRKFLNDYIDKIGVEWDKKSNTHNIKINFKLNIVKDKGELVSNDIYKIIKGKNDLDINGVNVRKFNNYINKKRQNKTYLLDYSTVTDFARFLG